MFLYYNISIPAHVSPVLFHLCWSFLFIFLIISVSLSFAFLACVSTGFPKTLSFSVFNTSCVPLAFRLRVLGDGTGSPSVSYEEHLADVSRNQWHMAAAEGVSVRPAEFTISPSSGSVSPQSHITIQVRCVCYAQLFIVTSSREVMPVCVFVSKITASTFQTGLNEMFSKCWCWTGPRKSSLNMVDSGGTLTFDLSDWSKALIRNTMLSCNPALLLPVWDLHLEQYLPEKWKTQSF